MARRKRRRTKRSRSQSTAARPRLTLGDSVRVKDGVMDPDYDGYCIGGWSGEIIALDTWEQTPMALIAWDATTQRDRIDPEVCRRAASQGLSAAQMWLYLSEFERVDGVKGSPRAPVQPMDQGGEPLAARAWRCWGSGRLRQLLDLYIGIPALEHRTQLAIERFDARLQQEMCPAFRPLHLLFLTEPFADHLVDC
jgi:hypothetical protein